MIKISASKNLATIFVHGMLLMGFSCIFHENHEHKPSRGNAPWIWKPHETSTISPDTFVIASGARIVWKNQEKYPYSWYDTTWSGMMWLAWHELIHRLFLHSFFHKKRVSSERETKCLMPKRCIIWRPKSNEPPREEKKNVDPETVIPNRVLIQSWPVAIHKQHQHFHQATASWRASKYS